MAEFKEVMRQWRRMCKSFEDVAAKEYRPCMEKCPVGANPVCGELCDATPEDVEKFEAAIMEWAAEHPEPVYPTWTKWLLNNGILEKVKGNIHVVSTNGYQIKNVDAFMETEKGKEPIPANIAQKLGIEPKEKI